MVRRGKALSLRWNLSDVSGPRKLNFPATFEADLVSPPLDREHAAHLLMTAPKNKPENPKQRFHASCGCRRSTLPLASSHSSRERVLARAAGQLSICEHLDVNLIPTSARELLRANG
jgi:hypothetical protein